MTDLRGSPALTPPSPWPGGRRDGDRSSRTTLPVLWTTVRVLLIVFVAAGSAYAISLSLTPLYGARAELLYELGETQPADVDRLLATQLVVLRSHAVLEPVATDRRLETEALADRVETEVLDDSQVIRLTVADPDPTVALELVAEIAAGYRETVRAGPGNAEETEALGPRLLSEPYLMEEPVRPRPLQAVAAGTLAGLLLAGGTVFVLYRYRLARS